MTEITEYNKGGACQCRDNECGKVFHQNDVKRIQTESYGQQVIESVCPYCGSNFGLLDYTVDESVLTYKDNKFFGLSHKQEDYIKIYETDEYIREVIDELYI